MNADLGEQEDELVALQSIFDSEFVQDESKFAGEIRVCAAIHADFTVVLKEGETQRQYEISFLPPLLLTFDLPEDYPSSSPPSFSLTCSWMTHTQIAALSAQLVDLYQATGGAVVLFSWVQFLREDAVNFLDIQSLLELPCDGHSTLQDKQKAPWSASDPVDPGAQGAASVQDHPEDPPQDEDRALCDASLSPSRALLSHILIYDAAQKQRAFDSSVFDCAVCLVARLGSDCVQLSECGHIFCQACLGEFCRWQITEGNVTRVTCPQADCTATPTPAQVRSLVGEELFSRYDRLLLQSTLNGMSDVTYCPRPSCAAAVIQDESSCAALCSVCGFAFCVTCRKTYHGTEDCQTMEKVRKLGEHLDLPDSEEGRVALWQDFATGSPERKRLLESRYGRNLLQYTLTSGLSESWVAKNSKPCPHCSRRIQKRGGCDQMTCSHCRQLFCWRCLTRFEPDKWTYPHFTNGFCVVYSPSNT